MLRQIYDGFWRRETGDGRRETGDGRRETGDGRRETADGNGRGFQFLNFARTATVSPAGGGVAEGDGGGPAAMGNRET